MAPARGIRLRWRRNRRPRGRERDDRARLRNPGIASYGWCASSVPAAVPTRWSLRADLDATWTPGRARWFGVDLIENVSPSRRATCRAAHLFAAAGDVDGDRRPFWSSRPPLIGPADGWRDGPRIGLHQQRQRGVFGRAGRRRRPARRTPVDPRPLWGTRRRVRFLHGGTVRVAQATWTATARRSILSSPDSFPVDVSSPWARRCSTEGAFGERWETAEGGESWRRRTAIRLQLLDGGTAGAVGFIPERRRCRRDSSPRRGLQRRRPGGTRSDRRRGGEPVSADRSTRRPMRLARPRPGRRTRAPLRHPLSAFRLRPASPRP